MRLDTLLWTATPLRRYTAALALFALALALRLLAAPIDQGFVLLALYPAMLLAYYLCGFGPGNLVMGLSAIVGYAWFSPGYWMVSTGQQAPLAVSVFIATGMLSGAFIQRLQSASAALRKALDELHLSERRYQNIVEDQTELICRFKSDRTMLYINPAYAKLFGVSSEDIVGRSWEPFALPEDLSRLDATMASLSAASPIAHITTRVIAAGGVLRWCEFVVHGIFDKSGQLLEIQGVGRDVTELRAAEEQTRQLVRDQAALLDNDLIGMIKNRDRTIVWSNKAFDRMFGYERGELLGKSTRVLHPSDASWEALRVATTAALTTGDHFRGQIEIFRKDGSTGWIDMSGWLMPNDSRESMWMMTDITLQKAAEQDRLRAVQLEAENRQILETSRLKGLFLANMSHELRTPLNAIIGFSRILQAGEVAPGSPRYEAYLGNILTSGEHLLQLIDATLDLTRIESGKLDFAAQDVELPALVSELFSILQPTFERKRMTVVTQIDPALGTLRIDPLRLKQIILNYLTNAVKFTPEAGHVTLRARPEAPGLFRIEVEDSGIGIAAADIPRLFTEFEQLQAASNRQYQGTGLGLALTRRLVEAQGGSVGVRSTPGVGSVFHALLPRTPDAGA